MKQEEELNMFQAKDPQNNKMIGSKNNLENSSHNQMNNNADAETEA